MLSELKEQLNKEKEEKHLLEEKIAFLEKNIGIYEQ